MNDALGGLYQQEILTLTSCTQFYCHHQSDLKQNVTVKNPICGDMLIIGLFDVQIKWHGEGCLICRASIELLCQIIHNEQMNYNTILYLCSQINDYFNGQNVLLPDKFKLLSSVKQTKSRIKCVTLAIQGIIKFIKGLNQ
jgi:NifU-like protein involved in Fe-S cluster formation